MERVSSMGVGYAGGLDKPGSLPGFLRTARGAAVWMKQALAHPFMSLHLQKNQAE
jgi:hypothetical protein